MHVIITSGQKWKTKYVSLNGDHLQAMVANNHYAISIIRKVHLFCALFGLVIYSDGALVNASIQFTIRVSSFGLFNLWVPKQHKNAYYCSHDQSPYNWTCNTQLNIIPALTDQQSVRYACVLLWYSDKYCYCGVKIRCVTNFKRPRMR